MPDSYQVAHETIGTTIVVRVSGRFDQESGGAVEDLLRAHPGSCVINLAGVEYISSSGVAALVKLTAQKLLKIASPSQCVRDVLSLAGVVRILSIHEDEKAALDATT